MEKAAKDTYHTGTFTCFTCFRHGSRGDTTSICKNEIENLKTSKRGRIINEMNIQAKAHTASSTESISFICNGLSAALDSFHE
jgi:hypothetical protein